jgi:phosphate transport system substrate-binding protein
MNGEFAVSNRLLALATGLVATFGVTVSGYAQQATITGAGASFPNPLYQKWAEAARQGANIQLNYQSVGSGAGQSQIRNRTVDFGASDAPMTAEQLKEANLLQFPATMGSIVAIVNIPGVESNKLRLTGEMLSDIYLGKITKWNDPKLVELNPDLNLPNVAVAPVYRADGSGTTFVWVSYLSAVSDAFKRQVGIGTSVKWPTGAGARGNEGVAGTVRNVRGAIGYVEYAYAHANNLVTTQLRNKSGQFVSPTTESFQAAATNADWSVADFAASVVDTQGEKSWPVVTPTFILLPKNPQDAARAQNVMKFFDWAYRDGDATASSLDYIPLPETVENAVRAAWTSQVKMDGKAVWPAN